MITNQKFLLMKSDKKNVVEIIADMKGWVDEMMLLREIAIGCGLEETIKWGGPVYTWEGKNILGLSSFKSYAGLWFYQGAFLNDPNNVLINAQEGLTKGLRQWRFASKKDIKPALIKKYILEAIRNAKDGKEIKPQKKAALPMPKEFASAFQKIKTLKASFAKLTPGKQREYIEYVAEAKGEDTRVRRVQKIVPMIENGIGLHDRYK
jgi:uncharacterized protein YdeI (YjbR/CyaY-like superfamily)